MSLPYIVEALNKAEDENRELRYDIEELIKAFRLTNRLINMPAVFQENDTLIKEMEHKYGIEI